MRRGWFQNRQNNAALIGFGLLSLLTLTGSAGTHDQPVREGGWLNLVVRPDLNGAGSSIEVRADLDADMYVSVRSVIRSLFVTIDRVWDPTVP